MVDAGRRRWLRAGALLASAPALLHARLAAGQVAQGVRRVNGEVRINGAPARIGAQLRDGDIVTTGADGELVVVWARDAMLVRRSARVEFASRAGAALATGLRVVTGALLSVFASGTPRSLSTPTATIGVRGTAVYLEVEAARSYVCTCYGEAELVARDDPDARETVRTTHHDQPRYIMAQGAPQMIMDAPVVNHTDAELTMLEALVGRRPPFADRPGTRPYRY